MNEKNRETCFIKELSFEDTKVQKLTNNQYITIFIRMYLFIFTTAV